MFGVVYYSMLSEKNDYFLVKNQYLPLSSNKAKLKWPPFKEFSFLHSAMLLGNFLHQNLVFEFVNFAEP
jgi:hypothetical protein